MATFEQPALVQGAVTVVVGAVSGGVTNAVAIWMLFHPHEPRRVGPVTVHGAIPKNKARLARSVGRTVGEKLLTAGDLAVRLASPALRARVDGIIGRLVDRLLEADLGSLQAEIPHALRAVLRDEQTRAELRQALKDTVREGVAPLSLPERLAARALVTDRTVESFLDGFEQRGVERLVAFVAAPAFRQRLAGAVGRWLSGSRADPGAAPGDPGEVLRRELAEQLWQWAVEQVPAIVAELDLPAMVEQKVLGFSTQRMEELVRTVTQRELDLIVRLGYLLGAIVGLVAFGVGQAMRG